MSECAQLPPARSIAAGSRCVAAALSLLVALGQVGCAHTRTPPPIPISSVPRDGIRTVAVVALPTEARLAIDGAATSPGMAAGSSGFNTFFNCVNGTPNLQGDGAALAMLIWLGLCTAAAGVSAGISAIMQPSTEKSLAAYQTLYSTAGGGTAQRDLAQSVAAAIDREPWPHVVQVDSETLARLAATGDYRSLAAAGVDHVVEIKVTRVGAFRTRDDDLRAQVAVSARLVRVADNTDVHSGEYTYTSLPRSLGGWVDDSGAALGTVVDNAREYLSAQIRDQFFFAYPFPYQQYQYDAEGEQEHWGLEALSPLDGATVYRTHPRLHWEAFPRKADRAADPDAMAQVTNVTYQLWIADGASGKLVYERMNLPGTRHAVESHLGRWSSYRWTVRASFELNGRRYVTDWSGRGQNVTETSPFNWYELSVAPYAF